ncbi:hypothetical protein [Methylobacterium gossipiicola]|uniref:Uncharacterized protein n=1 Tax=Methylobacterium gossipiicola TaxID=582675 RepID=A0A1I2TR92_9HYPH|nr:hypothetical protein [Methylobacterium gossipiicola]SFG64986.1 hypothetical protein SAMN05192565_107151 [Methylobacterium gossipiicola]
MATNVTPSKPPSRSLLHGQVGEIRARVRFDDNLATGMPMKNAFPAGAIITRTTVIVSQAFNAGTTNPLVVGSTPGGNDLVSATDSAAQTVGVKRPDTATALAQLPAETVPYVSYVPTGTAPTAGVADIVFEYVAPRG